MIDVIIMRVFKALELTNDFYGYISEEHLNLKIPYLPSNSIGSQVWCIIGARESYINALIKGEWDGFSCSLSTTDDKTIVINKLQETYRTLNAVLEEKMPKDINILVDLLEHEVQHHGQLIRYSYANGIGFPDSWMERYTV